MTTPMPGGSPWPRRLLIAGLIGIIVAVIDPMEGSIVILAAIALATFAARELHSPHRHLLYWALAFAAAGIGTLFALSSVGGFGGDTGRTNLWWFALAPYPIGWMMAIIGATRALRDAGGRPGL